MNGHFEIDDSAYPIGYMKKGDEGYRVTDMRTLKHLHLHPIPLESATDIASHINIKIRNGADYLKDGKELSMIGAVAIALDSKAYPI